jgi:hypothetical protein
VKTRKIYLIGYVDVIEGRSTNWVFDLEIVKEYDGPYPAHETLGSHVMQSPNEYPLPMTDRWIEAP